MVEFAVVAPLFFLMVFGMIEFGRMIMVQQVITNATREGARMAVLDGSTTTAVRTTVKNYLQGATIPVQDDQITVSPDPPTSAGYGEPVTVAVSISFDQVSWLPSPMFLGGRAMTATSVMRRETVQ